MVVQGADHRAEYVSANMLDDLGAPADDPAMFSPDDPLSAHINLLTTARGKRFGTVLADPPWQLQNRTGKVAATHS